MPQSVCVWQCIQPLEALQAQVQRRYNGKQDPQNLPLLLCFQAELAAQLLEEEWPDEDEVRAARMAVREEATPVPERAWALRNVASTLALGGPGERARARTLLEKAVTLKEQWLDDKEHPGMVLTS